MRGKIKFVIVVLVSAILVAGTSYALKRFGVGDGASRPSGWGSYKDNVLKASARGPYGPSGYKGCNSSGGGCNSSRGSNSSSCCGGGGGDALSVEQAKQGAIKYYASKYGDADVTCEVKDYGCHMEAEIIKDGKVLKKLSISGNRITEIT